MSDQRPNDTPSGPSQLDETEAAPVQTATSDNASIPPASTPAPADTNAASDAESSRLPHTFSFSLPIRLNTGMTGPDGQNEAVNDAITWTFEVLPRQNQGDAPPPQPNEATGGGVEHPTIQYGHPQVPDTTVPLPSLPRIGPFGLAGVRPAANQTPSPAPASGAPSNTTAPPRSSLYLGPAGTHATDWPYILNHLMPIFASPFDRRSDPVKAAELIRALPTVGKDLMDRVDRLASVDEEDDEGWRCSVCFEGPNDAPTEGDGAVKATPCHHLFHAGCLEPWFRTHTSCPMCRESLDSLRTQNDNETRSSIRPTPNRSTPSTHPYARPPTAAHTNPGADGTPPTATPARAATATSGPTTAPTPFAFGMWLSDQPQPEDTHPRHTPDGPNPGYIPRIMPFDLRPMFSGVPSPGLELLGANGLGRMPAATGPTMFYIGPNGPGGHEHQPVRTGTGPTMFRYGPFGPAGDHHQHPWHLLPPYTPHNHPPTSPSRPTPAGPVGLPPSPSNTGPNGALHTASGAEPEVGGPQTNETTQPTPANENTPPVNFESSSAEQSRGHRHLFGSEMLPVPPLQHRVANGQTPEVSAFQTAHPFPAPALVTPPRVRKSLASHITSRERDLGLKCASPECLYDHDQDLDSSQDKNEIVQELLSVRSPTTSPSPNRLRTPVENERCNRACAHKWHRDCLEKSQTVGETDQEGRMWTNCGVCKAKGWVLAREDTRSEGEVERIVHWS